MLAKQRANGVMMWEKWHDAPDANSLLKAVCDTIGSAYYYNRFEKRFSK
jgi:hypothetical protein